MQARCLVLNPFRTFGPSASRPEQWHAAVATLLKRQTGRNQRQPSTVAGHRNALRNGSERFANASNSSPFLLGSS
jgi:hypothetical protein